MTDTASVPAADLCQGMHTLEPVGYEGATRRGPARRVRMVCAGCAGSAVLDLDEDPGVVRVLTY